MNIIDHVLSSHVYEPAKNYLSKNGGNYLEIGLFNGIGFADVAHSNPKSQCHGIDPFIEDGHTIAASNKQRGEPISAQYKSTLSAIKELKNVTLHVMTSKQFLADLTQEKIKQYNISVVVVDGSHHYEDVVNDGKLAMTLIGDKTGLVIFDDMKISDVKAAYDEFSAFFDDRIEKTEYLGFSSFDDFVGTCVYIKGIE